MDLMAVLALAVLTTGSGAIPTPPTPWSKVGLDIDGSSAGAMSGNSVSMSSSGTRVAIGAHGSDGVGASRFNLGRVRIFELKEDEWVQMGNSIDGEASNDYSGVSVSLSSSGTRIAVGAYGNDGNGANAGHVRVYEIVGSTWRQIGPDIDGEAASDLSGYSVSLSSKGDRVAIGAYDNDGSGSNAGHVRIYEYDQITGTWKQMGGDIDGESPGDNSGISVSLSSSGTRVAVGARRNDGKTGKDSGHVRVYEFSDSAWKQMGADIDGEAADDRSGASVSLSGSGTRIAVGAYYNDGKGINSGHVRVYEFDSMSSSWRQMGGDIDGESSHDYSGRSVSLSSTGVRLAVGAPSNDGAAGKDSGHVRIYEFYESDSKWHQISIDIDGEAADDNSGGSVSLSSSGERVAIGAMQNDGKGNNVGHVRVYRSPYAAPTEHKASVSEDESLYKSWFMDVGVGGVSNQLEYSIQSVVAVDENGEVVSNNQPFVITTNADGKTAKIVIDGDLDRETVEKYTLTVLVKDGGNPHLQLTTDVVITVTDINDNTPAADQAVFTTSVSEAEPVYKTWSFDIGASDRDAGANKDLTFAILSAVAVDENNIVVPNDQPFVITTNTDGKTATISVDGSKTLDRETVEKYTLTVLVKDGGNPHLQTNTNVVITVTDINDNTPAADQAVFTTSVSEAEPVYKTWSFAIGASDRDAGANKDLTFAILSTVARNERGEEISNDQPFVITTNNDKKTATIGVAPGQHLDREAVERYTLTVLVEDGGKQNTTTDIVITVEDINDNTPRASPTNSSVSELSAIYKVWKFEIGATDIDQGENGKMDFSIKSTLAKNEKGDEIPKNDPFVIQTNAAGKMATISVGQDQVLDRETVEYYELTILIKDRGNPHKETTTTVSITVEGFNDNSPIPDKGVYRFSIFELEDFFESWRVQIGATDIDKGDNGKLHYSIQSTTAIDENRVVVPNNQPFEIVDNADGKTATIRVASGKTVDREVAEEYTLNIQIVDGGTPSLSSASPTTVIITVEDINDNPPVADSSHYESSTSEIEAAYRAWSLQIGASDIDKGENSRLDFSIELAVATDEDGNVVPFNQPFHIASNDGKTATITVGTGQTLDREVVEKYELTILIKDRGVPSESTETKVTIIVLDFNDNPPVGQSSLYVSSVYDKPQFFEAWSLQIGATDQDKGKNSQLDFQIQSSEARNNNGEIVPQNQPFAIVNNTDGKTATITVGENQTLDSKVAELYTLTIYIGDSGSPAMSTTIKVSITTTDTSPPTRSPTPTPNAPPSLDLNGPDPGVDSSVEFTERRDGYHAVGVTLAPSLVLSDSDDGNLVSATIKITNPLDGDSERLYYTQVTRDETVDNTLFVSKTLKLPNSDYYDSASHTFTMKNLNSKEDFETLLRTVSYINDADEPEGTSRIVSFIVDDGKDASIEYKAVVNIGRVNDAPSMLVSSTLEAVLQFKNVVPGLEESEATLAGVESVISDDDTDAKKGVAIISVDTSSGTWQFRTPGGPWDSVDLSFAGRVLLLSLDYGTTLRFIPHSDFIGTSQFSFMAWDGSVGNSGEYMSLPAEWNPSGSLSKGTYTRLISVVEAPTTSPTASPTGSPTTGSPTSSPSSSPTTGSPTSSPILSPTQSPTTLSPTSSPSQAYLNPEAYNNLPEGGKPSDIGSSWEDLCGLLGGTESCPDSGEYGWCGDNATHMDAPKASPASDGSCTKGTVHIYGGQCYTC